MSHVARTIGTWAILALALAVLPAGCGGGGGHGGSSAPIYTYDPLNDCVSTASSDACVPVPFCDPTDLDCDPSVYTTGDDTGSGNVMMELAQRQSVVAADARVTYTLTLVNKTAKPITYQPVSGGAADAVVPGTVQIQDAVGHVVSPTETSSGTTLPGRTLAPGQSVSATLTGQGLFPGPGRYTATATFHVGAAPTSLRVMSSGPLALTVQ